MATPPRGRYSCFGSACSENDLPCRRLCALVIPLFVLVNFAVADVEMDHAAHSSPSCLFPPHRSGERPCTDTDDTPDRRLPLSPCRSGATVATHIPLHVLPPCDSHQVSSSSINDFSSITIHNRCWGLATNLTSNSPFHDVAPHTRWHVDHYCDCPSLEHHQHLSCAPRGDLCHHTIHSFCDARLPAHRPCSPGFL
jgi:hypothetical protein